jgi:hypothetical protein
MAKKDFKPGRATPRAIWRRVRDNPEWPKEDFATAMTFAETLPHLAASIRKGRGLNKIK